MENKRQMLAVTGVSVEEFAVLLKYFSEALEDWSNERSLMPKKPRQRKPGGGRKSKFKSDRDRLFFLLFYLKSYPIFEILAATFDISTSGAQEKVYHFAQVLVSALKKLGTLPLRETDPVESLREAFSEAGTLLIDATERRHFRQKDYEKQKDDYSGKKKAHTKKNTILSNLKKYVLYLGKSTVGKSHDYGMLKDELSPSLKLFQSCKTYVDLGYLGIDKDYQGEFVIPHKKPKKSKNNPKPELTETQKKENREKASTRVIIEHCIAGIKRITILKQRFRNKKHGFNDLAILLGCGLWNFHLKYA